MTDPNLIGAFDGMADPKPKRGGRRSKQKGDRTFTGIEIDADHFEKARERISAALRQPDIFSNVKAEKHDGQQEVLFG